MKQHPGKTRFTPLRIALTYAALAGLWILLSDKLLIMLASSPAQALFMQTYKGWVFVAGTAALLYWMVRRGFKLQEQTLAQEHRLRRQLSLALESARMSCFIYDPATDMVTLEAPGSDDGDWETSRVPLNELVHPVDLPQLRRDLDDHLLGKTELFSVEHRVNSDDDWRWYMARGRKTGEGPLARMTGTMMDVTGRKTMEQNLLQSRRELLSMADAIPDFIARFDASLRHVFVNQALCTAAGIPREDYLGKTNAELGMPDHLLEVWNPALREVLHSGEERFLQFDFPLNGEQQTLHSRLAPEFDEQGQVVGVIGVTRDITELKQAHEALLASEKRLNDAQRIAHVASYERDLTTGKGFWSDEFYRLLGYAPGEKENSLELFLEHIHPDDQDHVRRIFQESQHRKTEFAGEFRYIRTNRQMRHGFISGRITRDSEGRALFYQGIFQDVTERKRAAEEYALLVTAIEQASECVMITDASGVLQYVNPAFEQTSGYRRHEILGHTPRILKSGRHDQEFYAMLWQRLTNGQVWHGRLVNRRKDGSLFEVDTTISPVRDSGGAITNYVALERDVTERTQLERQLRKAQKMEAIGTLAGGVAHDFNNILAAIMGFAEIALLETPQELDSVRESLQDILAGSRRGSELVRNILTFSRQGAQDKVPLQVQPLVKEALKLMRASLPPSVRISERLELEGGVVVADPSDLQQLLLNLCTNAGHSMEEEGGELAVTLLRRDIGPEDLARHPALSPGPHMLLRVEDTGPGIAPGIMDRIFDPFFTTKPPGKGTGLGLSIVHGIVQGNGGAIEVDSQPGRGAAFSVLLPLSAYDADTANAPASLHTGHQRILLAEDEQAVSRSLERMLALLGYEVVSRNDGREAFELFRQDPDAFDLLLTDHMMPGMNGLELTRRVLELRPGLPVILASGYGTPEHEQAAAKAGVCAVLAKPMGLQTVAEALHQALAAPGREED